MPPEVTSHQGGKYMGAPGNFAPKMQKREPSKIKKEPQKIIKLHLQQDSNASYIGQLTPWCRANIRRGENVWYFAILSALFPRLNLPTTYQHNSATLKKIFKKRQFLWNPMCSTVSTFIQFSWFSSHFLYLPTSNLSAKVAFCTARIFIQISKGKLQSCLSSF